jgi:putative transposase
VITALTGELIDLGHPVARACELTGYPRASFYRHHRTSRPHGPAPAPVHQRDRHQPAALSLAERAGIVAVLCRAEYAELSICQVFFRHLDTGGYIASLSSWYRVAREHALVGDRRRQARSNPKKIPELVATDPGQVWSWDITKLKGPVRGQYWHLYVIVDIFSRYVTGWALHHYEDGRLAEALITQAVSSNGGQAPQYLHSDNGSAMISKPVTALAALLGVNLSYSRPKVSNDNPYSEALFKTVKYDLTFPETFDSHADALAYCHRFFTAYNTEHRHSGIGYHTPRSVHQGTTAPVDTARQIVLDAAYRAHPERFTTRPAPPRLPQHAHINNKPTHKPKHLSQTG